MSTRPPVDLQLTSLDRCQAILNDFLAPLGAESPKCDFDDPSMVLSTFCSPRGAQVVPFGCLCASWAPLEVPSGPSRGSVFRSQSHFGRQTCQSVILSSPPMVFNCFCHPKGCPKGPFLLVLGLLGCTWTPQVIDFGPPKC